MSRSCLLVIKILLLSVILCPSHALSQWGSEREWLEEYHKVFPRTGRLNPGFPLDVFMEAMPQPSGPGQVTIRLTVAAFETCEDVEVTVRKAHNLEFLGPDVSGFSIAPHDTVTYNLSVVIPADDTSGLEIDVFCDRVRQGATIYFVAAGDSVQWSWGPPWGPHGHPDTWQRRAVRPPRKPQQESVPYKGPTTRRGYEDPEGNFIPTDSVQVGMRVGYINREGEFVEVPNPAERRLADSLSLRPGYREGLPVHPDSIWVRDFDDVWRLLSKEELEELKMDTQARNERGKETELERMHRLEQSPLTDADYQSIRVDGDKLFERKESEYKFKEVESLPPKNYSQWRDSVAMASEKTYDFTLDLRSPEYYQVAAREIDSLIPTDSTGFYRAIITFAVVSRLRDQGIVIRRTDTRSVP